MSKNRAPGICADRNSCLALRPVAGRCQLASRTATSGASRCSASQSVVTSHLDKRFLQMNSAGLDQAHADAAILLSLAFQLADAYRADFESRAHMCSAARLQVDFAVLAYADQPHPARTHRRLDRHGSYELGF